MKRVGNLYNELLDIKRIQNMYDRRIRINTKQKQKLEKFEYNYVSNIVYIKNVLESKSYKVGKYNIFLIKEPKVRLIMSQNIIDKIINHLVSEYILVKVFEPILINENIATRKNKGTHYGIKLVKKYLNEIKIDNKVFYILKFDVSKYFYNLDHDIIKSLVRKKIKDKDVLKLIDDIIDSTDRSYINENIRKIKDIEISKVLNTDNEDKDKIVEEIKSIPEYKYGKGLPIGNMSSQILAILYLNELDHFIKEKLKIKYYIRYMDDGIIIHEDKEYLKYCLEEIKNVLDIYKLKLNNKTQILNIKNGFEFLGFRFYIKNNKVIMKVKNQTKKRFKRKIKNMNKLLSNNKISYNEYLQVRNSYLGHLKHGNCHKLIKKTLINNKLNITNYEDMGVCVRIVDGDIVYL